MLCRFAEKTFPRTHKSQVRERDSLKHRIYACLVLFRTRTKIVTSQGCDKDKHLTKLDHRITELTDHKIMSSPVNMKLCRNFKEGVWFNRYVENHAFI